ncbi:PilZ domain-containing protein [Neptunomonas sp. XY-337]|uniref:PilZ domain-containing protein n=1 Tax=Neptunomonas sp. XY-337 TaxID=2561897 RepID=UPI001F1014C8|nr:PilZ domain-containing protein [Neptunomonas sp. XY-337]
MTEQIPERRRFTRIHFDARCILRRGADEWDVRLADICFKGALTEIPEGGIDLAVGDAAELMIQLDPEEAVIDMPVVLNHKIGNYLGFQLQRIDISSMTHLRRLVELNLGDPDLLERELDHLYHD